MADKEHKFKAEYLIPAWGLTKYAKENPAPQEGNKVENRRYALKTLPLALYNLAFIGATAMATGYGIKEGLEYLLK